MTAEQAISKLQDATGWDLTAAERDIVSVAVRKWPQYIEHRAARLAKQQQQPLREKHSEGNVPVVALNKKQTPRAAADADNDGDPKPQKIGSKSADSSSKQQAGSKAARAAASKRGKEGMSERVSAAAQSAGKP
jgi:hypothetical protein